MNRNQMNRFAIAPTNLDIGRSIFNRDHSVKFSFNCGDLIPFLYEDVLPGDTWTVSTSKVVRLQPLVAPIFDNLYLDTYYFFVPNRLVWTHWVNFMGENSESAWIPSREYIVPTISAPMTYGASAQPPMGFEVGTIADYLGIPPLNIKSANAVGSYINYSALPFRAYALICDQWFRDQNLMQPLDIPVDDTNVVGSNGSDQVVDIAKGGKPFIVCKYHDYFTSCLPGPQKGPTTTVPVNALNDLGLPVYASTGDIFNSTDRLGMSRVQPLNWSYRYTTGTDWTSGGSNVLIGKEGSSTRSADSPTPSFSNYYLTPDNLFAYVSDHLTLDIASLRTAFAIQKYYEKLARSGSRYIESIRAFYGVTSPDARMQRAEYLGGNRVPLNVSQVENTTNTSENIDPIGSVAGLSVTGDVNSDFQFSATEHGMIIGVCCVRYNHTYQQGVERSFLRRTPFDFYNPLFANISEQPVNKREIYDIWQDGDTNVTYGQRTFGYQEAWADYRYKPSRVAGEMRSVYPQSLDVWHLADDYSTRPSLSPSWIREDKSMLDRCLAVTSDVSNQIIADFYIQSKVSRPMPLYSIPGLIDHH